MQPEVEASMKAMVQVPAIADSARDTLDAVKTSRATENKTLVYNAAENRSLSTEEELFDALARPRNEF